MVLGNIQGRRLKLKSEGIATVGGATRLSGTDFGGSALSVAAVDCACADQHYQLRRSTARVRGGERGEGGGGGGKPSRATARRGRATGCLRPQTRNKAGGGAAHLRHRQAPPPPPAASGGGREEQRGARGGDAVVGNVHSNGPRRGLQAGAHVCPGDACRSAGVCGGGPKQRRLPASG